MNGCTLLRFLTIGKLEPRTTDAIATQAIAHVQRYAGMHPLTVPANCQYRSFKKRASFVTEEDYHRYLTRKHRKEVKHLLRSQSCLMDEPGLGCAGRTRARKPPSATAKETAKAAHAKGTRGASRSASDEAPRVRRPGADSYKHSSSGTSSKDKAARDHSMHAQSSAEFGGGKGSRRPIHGEDFVGDAGEQLGRGGRRETAHVHEGEERVGDGGRRGGGRPLKEGQPLHRRRDIEEEADDGGRKRRDNGRHGSMREGPRAAERDSRGRRPEGRKRDTVCGNARGKRAGSEGRENWGKRGEQDGPWEGAQSHSKRGRKQPRGKSGARRQGPSSPFGYRAFGRGKSHQYRAEDDEILEMLIRAMEDAHAAPRYGHARRQGEPASESWTFDGEWEWFQAGNGCSARSNHRRARASSPRSDNTEGRREHRWAFHNAGGFRQTFEFSADWESDDEDLSAHACDAGRTPRQQACAETNRHLKTLDLKALPSCSQELKSAYQGAAKKYHPDMVTSSLACAKKFRGVLEAYQFLQQHVT